MSSKPDTSENDAMIDAICEHLQKLRGNPRVFSISFERGDREIPAGPDDGIYRRFEPDGSLTIRIRMDQPITA